MKKILLIFVLLFSLFLITGCEKEEEIKAPAMLKEITGEIRKAEVNHDHIVIHEEEISNEVVYYSYEFEGVQIGLLAVRNSRGKVIVVVNTCQSCGGSPYAYFVQVGDKIQCQNCGYLFNIDDLEDLDPDGCNPIGIEDRVDKDGDIFIGVEQLQALKDKFVNWKGPKL